MKTQIYPTYSDFLAREDKTLNGVTQTFADLNPGWDEERENEGCWSCSRCSDCFRCSRCSDCSGCSGCSGCSDLKPGGNMADIPVLPGIHTLILEAASKEGALKMDQWHTCETTHCRAGWVVHLAGDKGRALEAETTTEFAAMQIYKASSQIRVAPPRFYETNKVAMADIKRCAEEEAKLAAI